MDFVCFTAYFDFQKTLKIFQKINTDTIVKIFLISKNPQKSGILFFQKFFKNFNFCYSKQKLFKKFIFLKNCLSFRISILVNLAV